MRVPRAGLEWLWARRWRVLLTAAGVLLVLFSAITARLFVWPDFPALPAHADAIIEFAGPGDDSRDAMAMNLAREGRAPVLIQSTLPTDSRCLPPIPGVTIMCFHPDPDTTRGEARYVGEMQRQYGWKSVIIVTTVDQAWRARIRVTRCFDGAVYMAPAGLPIGEWPRQIAYQWAASAKALLAQTDC